MLMTMPMLNNIMQPTFEVYVHVPFCMKRCGYCDFNTYTAVDMGSGASRANYATMAIREMEILHAWQLRHGINEPSASTVFFGGGTPTILPAHDLVKMLNAIRRIWGLRDDAEITTEANPDTVNYDYIRELADGGFNRISFGMQSAVPSVLAALDRTHTPANVEAGIRSAQKIGMRNSVDLIYGTPGESLEDWKISVRTALNLGVEHISAYALTVEPHTAMGRKMAAGTIAHTNDDDQADKYEIADDMFEAAGLPWYEVSNWSVPGNESQHNLGYWRNDDWAGIGPGAHSHYNYPGLRAWDTAHPKKWAEQLNSGVVPWADNESIDHTENIEEVVLLGMRIREGLNLDKVHKISGYEVPEVTINELVRNGLVNHDVERHRLIATRQGRLLNDSVIETILGSVNVF